MSILNETGRIAAQPQYPDGIAFFTDIWTQFVVKGEFVIHDGFTEVIKLILSFQQLCKFQVMSRGEYDVPIQGQHR